MQVLIRRILEASTGEFDPARAHAAAALEDFGAPCTWQEAFGEASAAHGLRARPVFLSARDAVGAASPRTPLVTHRAPNADGGPPGWLALLDRSWSRGLATRGQGPDRWLGPAALAAELGAQDADALLPWLLLEPDLTAAGAAAPAKAKGALPPLRRLFELVRPDRVDLWTVVLFAAVIGALTLATPIAVQQLVNTVAFGGLIQPVVILALLLFGGLAFSAVLSVLQAYTAELIQRRLFVRVSMDLATRLPRVELGTYDRQHGPELVNRVFDVFTVQKVGALLLLEGTSVLLQTGVGLLILSFYHPLMLGFSVLLVAGVAFVVFVLGRGAVRTAIAESNAKYAAVGWMEELARHAAAFRGRGGTRFAAERADRLAAAYITARRRHYRIVFRQLSGALALQVLASSALLALGGALVVAGQLTLGQLVASELIITAIVAAVAKLGKQLESLYDVLAATDKLGVLFDLPLEREGGAGLPGTVGAARVELRDLTYRYPSGPTLGPVDARIEAGERVALVGPVGSGKSTFIDMLGGLRAPTSGFVAVDDCDLRDVRLEDFRHQVQMIRHAEVFAGTVLDNLRVVRPGLSLAEASEALAEVGLLEAVRALPDGLHTRLATDGRPLSRGRVAALMLARALVARPRLLLLDKAFTSLDEAARKRALDAVFAADAPWTVVVVSERPDVISRCNRVIELGKPGDEALAAGAEGGMP